MFAEFTGEELVQGEGVSGHPILNRFEEKKNKNEWKTS